MTIHPTSTTSTQNTSLPRPSGIRRFVTRHPVAAFSVGAFGIGWPLLALPASYPSVGGAFLLAFAYLALFGSALVVTRIAGGAGAVRRLLSRLLRWRFSPWRWAVIVLGMPALTLAVAAASGTLESPTSGWLVTAGNYLFQTFIFGALMVNLAEETAWSGLVQSRFAGHHRVLRGAVLTAPLFVAIHLPLQFAAGWTWAGVGLGVAVLAIIAPFFRYVLGDHLEATGGSLLAVGVQHAAFNASGQLGLPGGWQNLVAVVVLAVAMAVARMMRRSSASRSPAMSSAGVPSHSTSESARYQLQPFLNLRLS